MKLNGNLVLNSDGSGTIQNAFIESGASLPGTVAGAGRLFYNTTTNSFSFSTGVDTWSAAVATTTITGNLQTEIDNIETASGGIFNTDGTYNGATLDALTNVTGSTSLANALTQLDTAISNAAGVDTLGELSNVTDTSVAGHVMYATGAATWATAAPGSTSGVQAHDDVLDDLSALAVVAADQMIYGTGAGTFGYTALTAFARSILDDADEATFKATVNLVIGTDVQAYDAGLDSIAGLTTAADTMIYTTAADTYATTTLTSFARGLLDDADAATMQQTLDLEPGVDVQAYDAGLAALAAYDTNGILVQTATNTFVGRSIAVDAGELTVVDGDGVAGNPTLGLASVVDSGTGTFLKLTTDGFGRVTGTTAVVAGDITTLVDSTYVNVAGDSMTGNLAMGTNLITGLGSPVADTDATNKAYVDAAVAGLSWKDAVRVADDANVDISSAPAAIDGVTLTSGDRVLLYGQTAGAENGIYIFNGSGSAMTRATDMDAAAEFDGAAVFVQEGTDESKGFTQTATISTVDTDTVVWSQFSGGAVYTWGVGLAESGNTINVNLGAGIGQLPSDEVGIDLESGKAIQLTSTATSGLLTFVLEGTTLTQSASGLKIAAAGVTETELNASVAGNGLTGGAGTALSVATTSSFDVSGGTLALASAVAGTGIALTGDVLSFAPVELTDTATVGADFLVLSDTNAAGAPIKRSVTDFMADLDIVNGITANGFTVRTAEDTYTSRSIAVSGAGAEAGLAVTNGDGVAGNPTVGLNITGTAALGAAPDVADELVLYDTSGTANVKITVAQLADAVAGATSLNELSDAVVSDYTVGDVLVADGSDSYDQKTVQYTFEATTTAQTSYTITHGLGQFVSVTVLDASTNDVIIPNSITMNATSGGETVITLSSALLIKAVIIGFNPAVTQVAF